MNQFKRPVSLFFIMIILSVIIITGCGGSSGSPSPPPVFHNDGEVRTLYQNSASGVNIVILGDGYIHDDLQTGGAYDQAAEQMVNFIMKQPPFCNYQSNINVYIIYAVSVDRGADSSPGKDDKNTVFNSTFGYLGIDRLLVVQNEQTVDKYISKSGIKPNIILMSVNSDTYGGSGSPYVVASRNSASSLIAFHELGHAFAGLTDEYADDSVASQYSLAYVSSYCNVDTTNNLKTIKWRHFIGQTGYGMVGAYEGGYYRSSGVWRPQQNCIMNSLNSGTGFCNVCREAIVKKICTLTKQTYSFNDFLQKNNPGDLSLKTINNEYYDNLEMIPDIIPHY